MDRRTKNSRGLFEQVRNEEPFEYLRAGEELEIGNRFLSVFVYSYDS
jgi:hypothetical protein